MPGLAKPAKLPSGVGAATGALPFVAIPATAATSTTALAMPSATTRRPNLGPLRPFSASSAFCVDAVSCSVNSFPPLRPFKAEILLPEPGFLHLGEKRLDRDLS